MTTSSGTGADGRVDVLALVDELSNWGRWGPEDRLGTLNLITPARRAAAAGLVRDGHPVSCAWEIDPRVPDPVAAPQRHMLMTGEGLADEHRLPPPGLPGGARFAGAVERIGLAFHSSTVTHLDALSHVFWDRRMYGGRPAEHVTAPAGAVELPVTDVPTGVTTRGVLLDVAAALDLPVLPAGHGVTPTELETAERRQGVRVGEGDAVLLRTGAGRTRRETGPSPTDHGAAQAGWSAACLPWLAERGVALIGCDTATDVVPSGYEAVGMPIPVHIVGLVAMGLWLLDNCDLEPLAVACRERTRWEFLLSIAPLRLVGCTGSPVNPIALF